MSFDSPVPTMHKYKIYYAFFLHFFSLFISILIAFYIKKKVELWSLFTIEILEAIEFDCRRRLLERFYYEIIAVASSVSTIDVRLFLIDFCK